MKKSVCMVSLCLGIAASGANAADVSVRGNLSETLEASDNYFLLNNPSGTTFKSLSAANLDVLARTIGTRYLLSSNVSYYNYSGSGAVDTNLTHGTPINETFRIDHATDLARYFFSTSWNRADLAAVQLRETGIVNTGGTTDRLRVLGGATHDLTRIDSLSWSAQASHVTFSDAPGQIPYNDYAASLAWNRLIDPRTTWITSLNFDWYDADDLFSSQRLFWQLMTGLKSQLTHRLSVTASAGATFANTWQNNQGFAPPGATPFQGGAASGAVGQAAVTYQLLKTTGIIVSAAHLIIPTTSGQLQKTTTAGFTIHHDINAWSGVVFDAHFAHTDSSVNATNLFAGTAADFFSAQVAYSYQLARDWRTRVSYAYRQRNDDTGTARNNTVLVSLVYNFNLMGNPTAYDPIDAERAFIRQQQAIGEVFPTLY